VRRRESSDGARTPARTCCNGRRRWRASSGSWDRGITVGQSDIATSTSSRVDNRLQQEPLTLFSALIFVNNIDLYSLQDIDIQHTLKRVRINRRFGKKITVILYIDNKLQVVRDPDRLASRMPLDWKVSFILKDTLSIKRSIRIDLQGPQIASTTVEDPQELHQQQ